MIFLFFGFWVLSHALAILKGLLLSLVGFFIYIMVKTNEGAANKNENT